MSVRSVILELEAKLSGKAHSIFSKPSGKVERKSYSDGTERFRVSVRNLKVPDQSTTIVKANGQEISQLTLTKGSGRLDTESSDPGSIPALEAGQSIEVFINDKLELNGKLYVD